MKKSITKAFTLVEMLIVIVIIGILIAALMPRMQAAQGRARDVARKTALSQVQSAIVTSQWDKWIWPWQGDDGCSDCAQAWIGLAKIYTWLTRAWMNSVPVDPLKAEVWWLGSYTWDDAWNYWYMVTTRNWTENWWFVLMAKTEVEWWSNWVVCQDDCAGKDLTEWCIQAGTDITEIHPCTNFEKFEDGSTCIIDNDTCKYHADGQLRYIVLY